MSNKKQVSLEEIVSLCKRRGFIFQGSEVYGGLAGTWDYGPLGVELKRNITNLWWKMFVEDRDDMFGVDAAILMNQKVWQASGHVDTFHDPLVEDLVTKKRYRADHLLEDNSISAEGLSNHEIDRTIKEKNLKSPEGNELSDVRVFNMMFKTHIGPVDNLGKVFGQSEDSSSPGDEKISEDNLVYLRPETAQGIFTNYKNVVDAFYPDIPFGIAQIGKAFRNEISPRDFVFRSREFEQMEVEYFIHPNNWENEFKKWVKNVHEFLDNIGIDRGRVHELEVPDEERAHYSKRTIDFEFEFPHKKDELLGLAYRTDFDLMNIQKATGRSMEYRPKDGSEPFVPHVIEPSFGLERAVMAVLLSVYTEDEINDEKRIVLKFPKHIAPVKAMVSPLLKNKPELVNKAREVYKKLHKELGSVMWDDSGNIGKRYRRQDEIGTPYCVTVDFESLENNDVTLRDRDTTKQKRVSINDLPSELSK